MISLYLFFYLYFGLIMEMIIPEIHFTCMVMVGIMTFLLAVFLPRHISGDRVLNTSRKLLATGTLLMTIHFACQYTLNKSEEEATILRTLVNLLFSIPVSHCVFLSYYYLQRKGNVPTRVKWFAPLLFILQLLILLIDRVVCDHSVVQLPTFLTLSFLYGVMLIYCFSALVRQYCQINNEIRHKSDLSLYPLMKWTRYSMLIMMSIYLIFPLMTYCKNGNLRVIYGLIFISATFFYVSSYIGYCFNFRTSEATMKAILNLPFRRHGQWIAHKLIRNRSTKTSLDGVHLDNTPQNPKKEEVQQPVILVPGFSFPKEQAILSPSLNQNQQHRIESALAHFLEKEYYTSFHLKKKDVAREMGISVSDLEAWLARTEYGRFNNWLMHLRIEKAKRLIKETPNLTSDEIADRCGFCNRQYFQLQFSKIVGMSPSQWSKTIE